MPLGKTREWRSLKTDRQNKRQILKTNTSNWNCEEKEGLWQFPWERQCAVPNNELRECLNNFVGANKVKGVEKADLW